MFIICMVVRSQVVPAAPPSGVSPALSSAAFRAREGQALLGLPALTSSITITVFFVIITVFFTSSLIAK